MESDRLTEASFREPPDKADVNRRTPKHPKHRAIALGFGRWSMTCIIDFDGDLAL